MGNLLKLNCFILGIGINMSCVCFACLEIPQKSWSAFWLWRQQAGGYVAGGWLPKFVAFDCDVLPCYNGYWIVCRFGFCLITCCYSVEIQKDCQRTQRRDDWWCSHSPASSAQGIFWLDEPIPVSWSGVWFGNSR